MGTFLEQIFVPQGVFSEGGKKQSSDCMISVVFSIFHILANNLTHSLIYTNMCVFLTRFSEFSWVSGWRERNKALSLFSNFI